MLDTGTGDMMREVVVHLQSVLQEQGIAHRFAVDPGGHDKMYWEPRMSLYLAFYAEGWRSGA
jgi:enterochelin esterase-like enzyme